MSTRIAGSANDSIRTAVSTRTQTWLLAPGGNFESLAEVQETLAAPKELECWIGVQVTHEPAASTEKPTKNVPVGHATRERYFLFSYETLFTCYFF